MDEISQTVKLFAQQAAEVREQCILNAMADGLDLHFMQIVDWITVRNAVMQYHCKAVPKSELVKAQDELQQKLSDQGYSDIRGHK